MQATTRRCLATLAWAGLLAFAACSGDDGGNPPPPATYGISGQVGGDTAGGVTITLSGDASATTKTDENGDYEFTGLSNGSYTVTASKTDFTFDPAQVDVTVHDADVVGQDFAANEVTYAISGTVSGATAEGVTITIVGARGGGTTTTDVNGNYVFFDFYAGTYVLLASKDDYRFWPESQATTVSGMDKSGMDFEAHPTRFNISGTVSGATAAGVTITLSIGVWQATTTTDANGNYTFTDLANGTYVVSASKEGYEFWPPSWDPTIVSDENATANFTAFATTFSISGTVSGAAASGVLVTLAGPVAATTTTDASGNYVFTGVPNGSYTLTPSKAGVIFAPPSLEPVVGNGDRTGQDFTAIQGYTVSGTVSGDVVSGLTITLEGEVTGPRTTTTDGSGNYAFTGVVNGTYVVRPPSLGEFYFTPEAVGATVLDADVTVQDFETNTMTYWIIGNVEVGMAGPAIVWLAGDRSAVTLANADGNYYFNGLPNGTYEVTPQEATVVPVSRTVTISSATVMGVNFSYLNAHWADWNLPPVAPTTGDYQVDAVAGTVTDTVTGLVWQRDLDTTTYTYSQAQAYCQILSLGGWAAGWRLPTAIELLSIVDYGTTSPAIDSAAFPATPATYFWTQTWHHNGMQVVDFVYGQNSSHEVTSRYRVRCVRG